MTRRFAFIGALTICFLWSADGPWSLSYAAPTKDQPVKSKRTKKSALPYNLESVKKLRDKGTGIRVKKSGPTRRAVRVKNQKLREAIALYREKKSDAATAILTRLLDDPSLSRSDRGVTRFFMGKALFNKRLYYASVPYFQSVIKDYRGEIYYPYSFQRLVWIARRDGRYDVLTDVLEGKKSTLVPRSYRDDVYFMLAKRYFDGKNYKRALRLVAKLQPGSLYYHEGLLMQAAIFVQQRKTKRAIRAFTEASEAADENVKGLAFLGLGRIYYGLGDDRLAAINYERVGQASKYWLMAQLEAAWAYFRANEPSLALGNTHPFDSEPFASVFSPEASIIKATVFFRLCKYPEAEKTILTFFERYLPTYRQIETFNAKYANDSKRYREQILKAIFKISAELPPLLTAEIFSQTWFDLRLNQLEALKQEKERLERTKVLAGTSSGRLSDRYLRSSMDRISKTVINAAVPLLKEWEGKLQLFFRQASLLRFESAYAMIDFESRDLRSKVEVPDDPQLEVWTFDDEYWRDELGDYRYLLRSECKGQSL